MADYINREETLKSLEKNITEEISGDAFDEITDIINSIPSVDAVEVVRCEECKHKHEDFCYKLSIIDDKQNSYYLVVNDNDYCKWGEKEEWR